MTSKLIAASAYPSSAGGQNDKDFLALIDAYAEARHVGGCHTYNAKTAEARAKVVASLAANAPAATAADGKWYMVNKDGMATLCADQADAEQGAKEAQTLWPHMEPHRVVQLVEAT